MLASGDGLAEAYGVAVAVANGELAAAVGLVAEGLGDGDAFLRELFVEGIGVVDPDVGVPGYGFQTPWGEMANSKVAVTVGGYRMDRWICRLC